jgi:hypothetical protein
MNIRRNNIDDKLIFDEESHTYTFNGHTFSCSVTQFVHSHFPHFNKTKVINSILKSKKINDSDYEYYDMTYSDIENSWNESAKLGTIMHAQIEDYYNSNRTKLPNIITTEFQYFLNFDSENIINPFRMEQRIYSLKLDIAGSIDLLTKNDDNTYSIIDWKRSKKINNSNEIFDYTEYSTCEYLSHLINNNFNHYSLQLNVYRYILETEYKMKIKNMFLVVLHPNNPNYIIIQVKEMDNEIEAIMNLRKNKISKK